MDRRYGIGADGVMLIKYREGYDFEMQFYNPDGSMSFVAAEQVLYCFVTTMVSPLRIYFFDQ